MASGYFGLYRGQVVNNADPLGTGRLQLLIPTVTGFRQTGWAEPSHPSGFPIITPNPGEPVWVQFVAGDTSHPVWMGIPTSTGGGAGSVVSFDALNVTGDLAVGGDLALTGTLTSGTVPWARLSGAPVYTTRWADWTEVTGKPTDLATTDTAQSITAVKTFTVSPLVPDSSWSIAATTGLQAALDSKYSPTNPQPVTPPSITGAMLLMGA